MPLLLLAWPAQLMRPLPPATFALDRSGMLPQCCFLFTHTIGCLGLLGCMQRGKMRKKYNIEVGAGLFPHACLLLRYHC